MDTVLHMQSSGIKEKEIITSLHLLEVDERIKVTVLMQQLS